MSSMGFSNWGFFFGAFLYLPNFFGLILYEIHYFIIIFLKNLEADTRHIFFFFFVFFIPTCIEIKIKQHIFLNVLNLKRKNVSRIRKKTFYLQFCMGTPEGHQKIEFRSLKVKKNQNFMWEFAGSTQNHKKIIEMPNQPIETKMFSKKLCVCTSKV
jgi:hypothetical protein